MRTRSGDFTTPTPRRPERSTGRVGPVAGDAVSRVFRHVRAVEDIAAYCWVDSDGTVARTPHHRRRFLYHLSP
jgi:hypothetical protein